MRNLEHYPDPTAGMAMQERPERLTQITGPERKKRVYNDLPPGMVPAVGYQPQKKQIKYFCKPAYTAK